MYGSFILLLNSQGFLHNKDQTESLIIKLKPKILCLTETHITEDVDEEELRILNYDLIQCDSLNSRTDGVLTFIHNDLKYKIIETKNIDQNTWISTVKLMGIYKEIMICNVYHSLNKNDGEFIESIEEE